MRIFYKYKIYKDYLKWPKKVIIKQEYHYIVCLNKSHMYLKSIM